MARVKGRWSLMFVASNGDFLCVSSYCNLASEPVGFLSDKRELISIYHASLHPWCVTWNLPAKPNWQLFFQLFSTCGDPNGSPQEKRGAIHNLAFFIVEFVSARLKKTRPVSYTPLAKHLQKKLTQHYHLTTNQRRWEGEKKGFADSEESTFRMAKGGQRGKQLWKAITSTTEKQTPTLRWIYNTWTFVCMLFFARFFFQRF